ncbi:hypothetical protein ACTVZO_25790 [Streptomyces sp. IBSNAI002]|uniref:hypothetical protein n=1 Tax=Streptomyces sp. IBSNAI002 TaxID=3457500 RepID=UPI003FD6BE20
MADERDRWLDKAAADRLLRGEPVEPVGPAAGPRARNEAARLRAALDSLAPAAPAAGELPGEAAAVAAFRAAHAAGAPASSGLPSAGLPSSAATGRSGEPLVALGCGAGPRVPAPRRTRAVRFGLAAALASVAVGGLAAAAGAGLLDRPGHDTAGPGPAMSVSADGDPAQGEGGGGSTLDPQLRPTPLREGSGPTLPPGTPHPLGTEGFTGSGGDPLGGGSSGTSAVGGAGGGAEDRRDGRDRRDGKDAEKDGTFRTDGFPDGSGGESAGRDRDRENQRRAVDLCHDYRAGHLNDDRRERLSRLAKGLSRIPYYCEALLDGVVHDDGRTNSPSAPADSPPVGRMLRDPAPVASRL